MQNSTIPANETESLSLKIEILVPSLLSFLSSLILTLIIIIYRAKQTTLSKLVLYMALSDLIYSFMGFFFTSDGYFDKCPWFLTSTREYTRLVSCGMAITFAYTTSALTKSIKSDSNLKFVNTCFICVLAFPLIFMFIFVYGAGYNHHYLDIMCWYGLEESSTSKKDTAKLLLGLPLIVTFVVTMILHIQILLYIKRRMEMEGNIHFSKKLYELLIYPLGIAICYIWFFFDDFDLNYDFIRVMDVISQQLQGLVNFFIFGMNYQTRTQMKDYWQRVSGRLYEFMHLQDKENTAIEMQTIPLNAEYTNMEKFQIVQHMKD